MIVRNYALDCVLGLGLTLSAPVFAAQADKANVTETFKLTATVEKIDYDSRVVTFKTDQGRLETYEISSEVKRLKEIKQGDRVQGQMYRAIAVQMNRHGVKAPPQVKEQTEIASAEESPGIAVRRDVTTTVTISQVDLKRNLVTITNTAGESMMLAVKKPQMQEFIKQLKKGDLVDVTYTEAVSLEVESASE